MKRYRFPAVFSTSEDNDIISAAGHSLTVCVNKADKVVGERIEGKKAHLHKYTVSRISYAFP